MCIVSVKSEWKKCPPTTADPGNNFQKVTRYELSLLRQSANLLIPLYLCKPTALLGSVIAESLVV